MYMTRPRPERSHQRTQQQQQPEQFFQNGSLAWRYNADDYDGEEEEDDGDSMPPPQHMDIGHFRWFWPWGVRRSSTFDTMPAGKQRLPVAATIHPASVFPQHQTPLTSSSPSTGSGNKPCLLFSMLPPELRLKIWTLVLQTECSTRWTYTRRSPAWRPDRTGAPFIDAAILRTCRAAYMEAWDLPMRLTRAVLADGSPQDKPAEWAQVVLSAGVLVPHAWQVLLLCRAEVTMQHFRLEAGFLDMWVAALGRLKAAAAVCIADLVAEAEEKGRGGYLNQEVVTVLRERQAVEEIVVRMNRADWWTWTSVPPGPWPEELPGECVADIRDAGRRRGKKRTRWRRRARLEEAEREWAEERERWIVRKHGGGAGDGGSETETEEEDDEYEEDPEDEIEDDIGNEVLDEPDHDNEVPETINEDASNQYDGTGDQDEEQEQGGYFSDYSASDSSSMAYIFDPATLPEKLRLEPFKPEGWDRPGAYGVLSPNLCITLMLETFGPKSLQLDAALDEVKTWRLPMPLMRDGSRSDVSAGSAVEDDTRVLAWDGRPVYEYHWLRDMSDEVGDAEFLRMGELKATAEGVVVKMMTLAPRRK